MADTWQVSFDANHAVGLPADRSSFGYDAVEETTRRRQPPAGPRSEDVELLTSQRRQLVSQSRDMMRNFAIARWAIGKHLDFVARHTFSCQTKTSFDTEVQDLMEEWSLDPKLCDITARHTFPRIARMTEARAVLDGDHLLCPLKQGSIQQIESDRLASETGVSIDGSEVHGVMLDDYGRATGYKIWDRNVYGGYKNPQIIPAASVIFHAYYPNERADQVRGIGLVTAGLNDFIDAYEWQGLTKATAKLRTAFAMIISSKSLDGIEQSVIDDDEQSDEDDAHACAESTGRYGVELGKGPFKLELDPGDDAKFLTDMSPSTQTFEFFKSTIGFALKALDIPLCFYDEGLTNFFGQKAALTLYLESCKTKRQNLVHNVLRPITLWKITQWIAQGRLKLPPNGQINRIPFSWQAAGCPYWNPSQEINADIQSIQAGLGNWEDIYLERTGKDWYRDMARLKEQQQFLADNDIKLDPKVIQFMQVGTDPSQVGTSPLSQLPAGGLAL